jgi:hypothetical protein
VHRCHPVGEDGLACNGIVGDRHCPLDQPIDVALVIRRGGGPDGGAFMDGARCAIRHDVPIVEQGSNACAPLAPWIAHRVGYGESIVTGCLTAAERAQDPLRHSIEERICPALVAAGIRPDAVSTNIERLGHSLVVHLDVPNGVERRLEQALAVRVLDAVRAETRTRGHVGVQVHVSPRRVDRKGPS